MRLLYRIRPAITPLASRLQIIDLHRNNHHATSTGDIVTAGCDRLPDLTLFWPFHFWPSDISATLMDAFQQSSGLPWWATIVIVGAAVKIPLFGFNLYNYRAVQQYFVTQPKMMGLFGMIYLDNVVTKGEHHALRLANDERRFTLFIEGHGGEKSMKPILRSHIYYLPIYYLATAHLTITTGLIWLNRIQYVPLTLAATPWCTDFTVSDPTYVLPSLCLASVALHLYCHPLTYLLPCPSSRTLISAFPLLTPPLLMAFSLLANIPVDIILYVCGSTLASTFLGFTLRSPTMVKQVGLISGGEVFNRIVPPSSIFTLLGITLERQALLLKQQEQQLLEHKRQMQLRAAKPVESVARELESGEDAFAVEQSEGGVQSENKEEGVHFVKIHEKKVLLPALNIHKKFDIDS